MQDRIRVAANAVIVLDDKVLLIEFCGGTDREHFNFPGGGVELGETLEEGVGREVMEEACLEVSVERLLLVVESVAARNTNEIRGERVPWNELRFFFLCHPVPGAEAQLPERPDEEETAVRWIPLAQLPTINVLPNVVTELLAAIDEVSRPTIVPNPHP